MASAAAARQLQPRTVGRYALFDEIAAGGMATVHYGRLVGPVGFTRTVAIKRLHPQFAKDQEFVEMFLDEAKLASRIQHPNVVTTLDVVAMEDELFLVMEYVAGESLAKLLKVTSERGERVPVNLMLTILTGMLHGLHAAHEATNEQRQPLNIVHRDISPQNVLVGIDGVSRVLDFGVAKAAMRKQSTRDSQMKGKLSYMSPEQLNAKQVDRRSDVFSAGIVCWEALTGQRLFAGSDAGEILGKVLTMDVVPPHDVPLARRIIGPTPADDQSGEQAAERSRASSLAEGMPSLGPVDGSPSPPTAGSPGESEPALQAVASDAESGTPQRPLGAAAAQAVEASGAGQQEVPTSDDAASDDAASVDAASVEQGPVSQTPDSEHDEEALASERSSARGSLRGEGQGARASASELQDESDARASANAETSADADAAPAADQAVAPSSSAPNAEATPSAVPKGDGGDPRPELDPPKKPGERVDGQAIDKRISDVIMRALQRDPGARWPTARDFAIALEDAGALATAHRVGTWVEQTAGEALHERIMRVAEIESYPTEFVGIELRQAPQPEAPSSFSGASVEASVDFAPRPSHKKRTFAVLLGLGLAGVAVAGVFNGAQQPPPESESVDVPATTVVVPQARSGVDAVEASNAPVATRESSAREAQPPAASAPSAVTSTQAPGVTAPTQRTRAVQPAPRRVFKRPSRCEPPWYLDKDGIKRVKKGCLPQ